MSTVQLFGERERDMVRVRPGHRRQRLTICSACDLNFLPMASLLPQSGIMFSAKLPVLDGEFMVLHIYL